MERHYNRIWRAFDSRLVNRMESFIETVEENGLTGYMENVQRLISIGAGDGAFDRVLLEQLFKHLKQYQAIEPNYDMFQEMKGRMEKAFPNVEALTYNMTVEDWNGPKDGVDCVILGHVLYYVKHVEETIQRCLSWLQPGGYLLIVIIKSNLAIDEIAREFNVGNNMVSAEGVRNTLHGMNVQIFKELTSNYKFDISKPDKDFIDFMLYRDSTEAEVRKCKGILAQLEGREHSDDMEDKVFVIKHT